MELKFLGTGGYDDLSCGTSSAILFHEIGNILIDCGPPIYERLVNCRKIGDIDYLILTHLHGDHMGSLFSLIVKLSKNKRLKIIIPNKTFQVLIETLLSLWFNNYEEKVIFVPIETLHGINSIDTLGKHAKNIQTFAYIFEEGNEVIYYSGDLNDVGVTTSYINSIPKDKDITIFHEVTWNELFKSHHCWYRDIESVLLGYRVYLYHCNHVTKPTDCKLPCVAELPDLLINQK